MIPVRGVLRPLLAAAVVAGAGLLPLQAAQAGPDTLFPEMGNGGYDVRLYGLDLRYEPGTNQAVATVRVRATATRTLETVPLDYAGPRVTAVAVDGVAATWDREAEDLVVTPGRPVAEGPFTVTVSYAGRPPEYTDADGSTEGWVRTGDGALAVNEPLGTMTWLPVNNEPSDKARFRYRVQVPTAYEVVANGALASRRERGGSATWTWGTREELAPHLAVVGIGQYRRARETVTSVDGRRLPLDFFEDVDTDLDEARRAREAQVEALRFLEARLGPYPFANGGHVIDDAYVGYALETQGRPFYPQGQADPLTVVHETAHQWFGNSVGIVDWHDLWLAEGFAVYAEWLWTDAQGGRTPQEHFDALYARDADDDLWSPAPTEFTDPADLFGPPVYLRGAMTLQALRARIGGEDFATLLRRWVQVHEGGTVRTADFERLAEKVSGRRLDGLFEDWLRTDGRPQGY